MHFSSSPSVPSIDPQLAALLLPGAMPLAAVERGAVPPCAGTDSGELSFAEFLPAGDAPAPTNPPEAATAAASGTEPSLTESLAPRLPCWAPTVAVSRLEAAGNPQLPAPASAPAGLTPGEPKRSPAGGSARVTWAKPEKPLPRGAAALTDASELAAVTGAQAGWVPTQQPQVVDPLQLEDRSGEPPGEDRMAVPARRGAAPLTAAELLRRSSETQVPHAAPMMARVALELDPTAREATTDPDVTVARGLPVRARQTVMDASISPNAPAAPEHARVAEPSPARVSVTASSDFLPNPRGFTPGRSDDVERTEDRPAVSVSTPVTKLQQAAPPPVSIASFVAAPPRVAETASGERVSASSFPLTPPAASAPSAIAADVPPAELIAEAAPIPAATPVPPEDPRRPIRPRAGAPEANFAEARDEFRVKFAASRKPAQKTFVSSNPEGLMPRNRSLGIDVAELAPIMPSRASSTLLPHPDSEYAAAGGLSAHAVTASGGLEATPVEVPAVPSAHAAVDVVLRAADRAATREQHSVRLRFSVGDADLDVRIELRADEVRTTFTTASAELRSALSHEWQAVAHGSAERTLRMAPATFTSPDPSPSGSWSGDASSRERQQAQHHPAADADHTFLHRQSRAESRAPTVDASDRETGAAIMTARASSRHLSTLA